MQTYEENAKEMWNKAREVADLLFDEKDKDSILETLTREEMAEKFGMPFIANLVNEVRNSNGNPFDENSNRLDDKETFGYFKTLIKLHLAFLQDKPRNRIGDQLRAARNAKGFSQEEVARRAGLSKSTINKIEGGKWSASVDLLQKICTVLNCKLTIESDKGIRE